MACAPIVPLPVCVECVQFNPAPRIGCHVASATVAAAAAAAAGAATAAAAAAAAAAS